MPNSFPWWQEIFGSTSEYNNATNYIFKKSSSKCSSFYVGTVFTNMPSCFSELSFCGSKSENKDGFFVKKKIFLGTFPRTRGMQVCHCCRKNGQKLRNVRSIFENNYKNKQFSQKTISWENVSSHIDSSPGSLSEKTSPEIWKVSCSKKVGEK